MNNASDLDWFSIDPPSDQQRSHAWVDPDIMKLSWFQDKPSSISLCGRISLYGGSMKSWHGPSLIKCEECDMLAITKFGRIAQR